MNDKVFLNLSDDRPPLTGEQLRELRLLAGFSRSALETAAKLTAGRVRSVENGYVSLRRWESTEIRRLLLAEMAKRAREIAEHLRAGEPATTENRELVSP